MRQSVSSYRSNKKQLQKHVTREQTQTRKTQEDKEWEFRKSMNPFATNVGMARQLKKLNIGSNDQVFKTEDVGELLDEMDDTVEAFRDKSLEFRKQMEADKEEQRIRDPLLIIFHLTYFGLQIVSLNRVSILRV